MIGLLIFGVAAGYVALWYYVFKTARNRGERVAAVLVAVLIPFWDLPIGYFEFQRHCRAEGGVHVYDRIPAQVMLYFESAPLSSVNELLKQGFSVVEISLPDGKGLVRHELEQGRIISRIVESPESPIAISITRNEKLSWNIYRDQHVARSINPSKLVATYSWFSWRGGWLQKSTWPWFRGSFDCFLERNDPLIALLRHGS